MAKVGHTLTEDWMRLHRRAVRRGGTFLVALAMASLAASTPCFAIETGTSPNLPPPPPPPLSTATPGTSPPPPSPRPARPAPAPAPAPAVTVTGGTVADSGPVDSGMHALDTRWFIAPLLGFASEDLNFGIGVRAGKTLDNHIYIGGTFVYQVGDSGSYAATVAGPGVTTTNVSGSWSYNGFYIGPEGGYDFDLRYVVVRPYMGIGLFDITGSAGGGGATVSSSQTQFVIWPGCTVIWNVPNSNFFLGGDLRVITVPGGAVGVYAMGGIHLGS
jgi:hypothetical protein